MTYNQVKHWLVTVHGEWAEDFELTDFGDGVPVITHWGFGFAEPTEQDLASEATADAWAPTIKRREAEQAFPMRRLVRALALVMMDGFNQLRSEHSLPAFTQQQLYDALIAKVNAGDAD